MAQAFRTGEGIGWHQHHDGLFHGTERAFAANYRADLVGGWLPALDGVVERLQAGGSVLDVGCGHGASCVLMAQAFPAARFVGVDAHPDSVAVAAQRAAAAGVDDRVRFAVATATALPPGPYDLVAFFDALHDMGDPVAVARAAHHALAPDGSCLVVEPYAGDTIVDNLTPVGRLYYGMSRWSARRAPARREVRDSGRRRARRRCARSCWRAASRRCAGRRRRRST
jgi:SAM-dependent methyltransferase